MKAPNVKDGKGDLDDPSPAWDIITPHDTNPQGGPWRGLSFGTAGDIALEDSEGNALPVIPSGHLSLGVIHPVSFGRVKSTGTTATVIIGWK